MKLFYTLSILLLFGITLPLCGQVGMNFIEQDERVRSVVFVDNEQAYHITSNVDLYLDRQRSYLGRSKSLFKGTMITVGLGFVVGTTWYAINGPYEELSKGESIFFYSAGACLFTFPLTYTLGGFDAKSITDKKPKNDPLLRY